MVDAETRFSQVYLPFSIRFMFNVGLSRVSLKFAALERCPWRPFASPQLVLNRL